MDLSTAFLADNGQFWDWGGYISPTFVSFLNDRLSEEFCVYVRNGVIAAEAEKKGPDKISLTPYSSEEKVFFLDRTAKYFPAKKNKFLEQVGRP